MGWAKWTIRVWRLRNSVPYRRIAVPMNVQPPPFGPSLDAARCKDPRGPNALAFLLAEEVEFHRLVILVSNHLFRSVTSLAVTRKLKGAPNGFGVDVES